MYKVISDRIIGQEVYGIQGYGLRVANLSTDREAVAALADRCCKGELDPSHLWDVAEDWVQEEAM